MGVLWRIKRICNPSILVPNIRSVHRWQCNEEPPPVLILRERWRLSVSNRLPAEAEKSSSASYRFCHFISFLISVSSCVWSLEQNSTWPHRAVIRCLGTTHDAVYLPFSVWFGSVNSNPHDWLSILWLSSWACDPLLRKRDLGGITPIVIFLLA